MEVTVATEVEMEWKWKEDGVGSVVKEQEIDGQNSSNQAELS